MFLFESGFRRHYTDRGDGTVLRAITNCGFCLAHSRFARWPKNHYDAKILAYAPRDGAILRAV